MASRLVRGVSAVFASQVLGMASKGVLIVVLTRFLLRPSEYGLLFLTISVLGFAMLVANLGFEKAGARYVAEYRESDPSLVTTAVRKTLLYNAGGITIVGIGLLVLHGNVANAVGEPAIAGMLLFGVGYVATKSLKGTAAILLQGFNQMTWVAAVNIVTNLSLVVAVPSFIILGFGLEGAIVGYIVSYGVGAVVGLGVIATRFYVSPDVGEEDEAEVASRILRYSVPLTFTMSANVVDSHTDKILLSVFRGPSAIAFYTLGKQIADFIITPAQSLGFAVSPTFGEQKAKNDVQTAARLYEQTFRYTISVYGPAAAGVILVAEPTIRLIFGSEYFAATPVLQVFSVFIFVRAIDKITNDALDFLGRAQIRASAKGLLAVANVLLNLVLIPPFGIIGATVATVFTYSVLVSVELFVMVNELPIDVSRLVWVAIISGGITAGMSAVVYPLTLFISGLPSLALVIAIGGFVWAFLTALSGVVDFRHILFNQI